MYAFMKTDSGYLLKAYEVDHDWQVIIIDPNGTKVCERWVTIWLDENHYPGAKRDSLKHAFSRGCDAAESTFDDSAIHIA